MVPLDDLPDRRSCSDVSMCIETYLSKHALDFGSSTSWEITVKESSDAAFRRPRGDQINHVEMMDITNGVIPCHQIYGNWVALKMLVLNKQSV